MRRGGDRHLRSRRWLALTAACSSVLATLPAIAVEVSAEGVAQLPGSALSPAQTSNYVTGLITVFALLALLFWISRWLQTRAGAPRAGLRVRASLPLGGKERLMVVEANGERLLIGVAPGGVQLVRVLDGDTPEEPVTASWLARTLNGSGEA